MNAFRFKATNLSAWILFTITSVNVYAADSSWLPGECRAETSTHTFIFNFLKNINDLQDNDADKIYLNAFSWNNNSNYNVSCNCSNNLSYAYTYYKASSPLPYYKTEGEKTYYKINENLAVSSQVYIWGPGYLNVPFVEPNQGNQDNRLCTMVNATSGSAGNVDLLIIKPFIGTVNIQPVDLVEIHASLLRNSFGNTPISRVNMNGSVTVQQSCEINAGNSIQVDFGDMYNGNFKGQGTKPEGVNSKTIQLGYKCNLVSKGMDVNMRFTGQSDSNYPNAFSTNNPDIGVIIQDGSGNAIKPNTGTIPMTVDYDTQTGSVDITTYPVSTTGNIPVVGQFTSRATVVVDFQ